MEDRFTRSGYTTQELIKPSMTEDDWRRVANMDQIELMRVIDRWLQEPVAAELLDIVAHKEPLLIFQYIQDIQGRTDIADQTLQLAAERASEVDPGIIFFYFPLIQDKPYNTTVLVRAADECLPLRRTSALEFAQNYLSHPEAESILSRTAERFPAQAIYFYQNYQSHPAADNILRASIGLDPKSAIVHARRYAEAKEAKVLLQEAIAKDPETARVYKERYAEFLE